MGDIIRLTAGDAFAVIALKGAEPLAWSIRGRDLLWNADPAYWERTSPILFPIVGRARNDTIHVDGRPYGLGVHGFAAMKQFSLVTQTTNSVRLILRDDGDTREMFPFPFELEVNFELEPSALSVRFLVRNSGATALPYAIGFHPGFPWTLDKGREEHRVEFEQDEVPIASGDYERGVFSGADPARAAGRK